MKKVHEFKKKLLFTVISVVFFSFFIIDIPTLKALIKQGSEIYNHILVNNSSKPPICSYGHLYRESGATSISDNKLLIVKTSRKKNGASSLCRLNITSKVHSNIVPTTNNIYNLRPLSGMKSNVGIFLTKDNIAGFAKSDETSAKYDVNLVNDIIQKNEYDILSTNINKNNQLLLLNGYEYTYKTIFYPLTILLYFFMVYTLSSFPFSLQNIDSLKNTLIKETIE